MLLLFNVGCFLFLFLFSVSPGIVECKLWMLIFYMNKQGIKKLESHPCSQILLIYQKGGNVTGTSGSRFRLQIESIVIVNLKTANSTFPGENPY